MSALPISANRKEGTPATSPVPGALTSFDMSASVEDLLEFAESGHERFPTGYSLDNDCGLIGPGELGLIWARSGSGKSTLVLNMINRSADVPSVFFNMEMPPRRLTEWLCSMANQLETPSRNFDDVLRWGPDQDGRYEEIVTALRGMQEQFPHLRFVRPDQPSMDDFARTVDEIGDETGVRPKRVFIDHLTLMADTFDYRTVNERCSQLHSWAMAEGLAVIAIQQTGRGASMEGKNDGHIPVTLSSGIFGGEADADFIWGMYRPERDPKFKKPREQFRSDRVWETTQEQYKRVRGITRLQLIKNRPFGEVNDEGVLLRYDTWSRRLIEPEED